MRAVRDVLAAACGGAAAAAADGNVWWCHLEGESCSDSKRDRMRRGGCSPGTPPAAPVQPHASWPWCPSHCCRLGPGSAWSVSGCLFNSSTRLFKVYYLTRDKSVRRDRRAPAGGTCRRTVPAPCLTRAHRRAERPTQTHPCISPLAIRSSWPSLYPGGFLKARVLRA